MCPACVEAPLAEESGDSDAFQKRDRAPPGRVEYDFTGGVRGKYAKRYAEGSNVVVLDPDVVEHFKTSEDVNRALRELADKEAS